MKQKLKQHFDENIVRVRTLTEIYHTKLAPAARGRKPVGSTDILRAAVVFLHATLEEYLRGILKSRLPAQGAQVLDSVPLAGLDTDRAEKFYLGRLDAHRGKTVDALIAESVELSLARSNFNSIEEIVKALNSVGLDHHPCQPFFSLLKSLMERRHQIVHRADRNSNQGQGHHETSSIGLHHVHQWTEAAQQFFNLVHSQLP